MRLSVGRFGLVAALAAITSIVACRQLVGITDNPPEDLVTSICGLPYGTNMCASCANTNCCSESTTCAADPVCSAYEGCFGNCNGDPKCWAQCLTDFPVSGADVTALSVCMATSCETQCNLTCGAFSAVQVQPDAAVACQSCIVKNACAPAQACARSSDCDAIVRCLAGCSTIDCDDTCYITHGSDPAYSWEPDGGNGGVYGAFTTTLASCVTECGLNSDWSCVGHRSWPAPTSSTETYHFWVKDFSTGMPVIGADVALCGFSDAPCNAPLKAGMTDTAGSVALPLQDMQDVAGQQSQGLSGFLMVTSASIRPVYYYWGFPLSQAGMYSYAETTTLTEFLQLSATVGVTPDSNRGSVSVAVYDCAAVDGQDVSGVQVTLSTADAMTHANTPMGVATTITDSSGIIIFNNVPVGNFQVTATPTALGKPSSQVSATVRAGATTEVLALVTP
jgi:hypothetical protein